MTVALIVIVMLMMLLRLLLAVRSHTMPIKNDDPVHRNGWIRMAISKLNKAETQTPYL